MSILRISSGTTNLVFTASLDVPSPVPVSIDFATADNTAFAAYDYTATNGTLIFNPGETNKSIPIQVMGEVSDGMDDSFLLTLANPSGLRLTSSQATATLLDPAAHPPLLGPVSIVGGQFMLSWSAIPGHTFRVQWTSDLTFSGLE